MPLVPASGLCCHLSRLREVAPKAPAGESVPRRTLSNATTLRDRTLPLIRLRHLLPQAGEGKAHALPHFTGVDG
jgi:hypothetical protein